MPDIKVKHKDGSIEIIPFPDSMSREQIKEALRSKYSNGRESESKQEKRQSTPLDYLKGALQRISANLGVGASETGRNIGNFVGGTFGMPHVPQPNYQQEFGAPREQDQNILDKIIQATPELGMAIATPAARAPAVINNASNVGRFLKAALQSKPVGHAVSQGSIAATQSPENAGKAGLTAGGITAPFSALAQSAAEGNPKSRLLLKGLLGIGVGTVGFGATKATGQSDLISSLAGLGAGAFAAKHGISPNRIIKKDALKGVEGTNYQEALDTANRLGLKYLTPAEASGNQLTGAYQGGLGKTERGAEALYKSGNERLASEKSSIQNFMKNIFNPEEHEKLRESLYASAKPKIIPEDKLKKFENNEIFTSAKKDVLSKPAYREKLKDVPENSIEYLDMVKRRMGDEIETAKRVGNKTEASLIKNTQKDLMKTMDKVAPEYKEARAIAERGIVRTKLEDFFKKKSESMNAANFGKFLSNEKNYEKLNLNLRNAPEAQKQLHDMKMIFHRLINIPTAKAAEAHSRTSMSKFRASSDAAITYLKEILTDGKFDKKAVELITNPHWAKELEKLKSISNTDKFIGKTYDVLGKIGGQTAAKQGE